MVLHYIRRGQHDREQNQIRSSKKCDCKYHKYLESAGPKLEVENKIDQSIGVEYSTVCLQELDITKNGRKDD